MPTMTAARAAAAIRRAVAKRPDHDRCSPGCPGWIISHNGSRWNIETCDECKTIPDDDTAAILPEAQSSLRRHRYGKAAQS